MDSSLRKQLEWYSRQDLDALNLSQLCDYIWHIKEYQVKLLQLYNDKQLRAPIGKSGT